MPTPRPRKLADGTVVWRVQFRTKPGGAPTSETFDTMHGAQEFCALIDKIGGQAAREMRDAIEHAPDDALTLNDLMEIHVTAVESHGKKGTAGKYRKNWELYLAPTFGHLPASALTRPMVEEWLTGMRARETRVSVARRRRDPEAIPDYLSAKTIKNAHGLLSSVLSRGVQEDLLVKNVAEGLPLPKGRKKIEPVFLTAGEFAKIYEAVGADYRPFIAFLAGTGLRWGEATAITGADVLLGQSPAVVRVTKAWNEESNGALYLDTVKTVRSNRTVTLPPSIVSEIAPLVEKAGVDGYLFQGRDGKNLRRPWFLESVWYPALDRAGVERRPRIHDLRHSHASWLIAQGVGLPVIQRRLGHESIKTTVDVYGHLAPDAWAGAADAAELALVGALPQIGA